MQASLRSALFLTSLLGATLAMGACSNAPTQVPLDSSQIVATAKALEVKYASSPEDGLMCAGMLTEDQFKQLAEDGFVSFINLRLPTEEGTGWEAEFAKTLGVNYVNLPVEGKAGINELNARELSRRLDEVQRPAVLYCGSSNRVGALYGLGAYYVDGASPEDALAKAKSAGLTRLEPTVREQLALPELPE